MDITCDVVLKVNNKTTIESDIIITGSMLKVGILSLEHFGSNINYNPMDVCSLVYSCNTDGIINSKIKFKMLLISGVNNSLNLSCNSNDQNADILVV